MKAFVIAVVLLACGASGSLCAQTLTAQNDSMVARGWTYVRNFDSVNQYGVRITAYGDTVLFEYNYFYSNDSSIRPYSFEGGKTIEGWMAKRPQYCIARYWLNTDPTELDLFPDSASGKPNEIEISTDVGRTYQKRWIDTSQFHFEETVYCGDGWIDPTNNGTIYIEYGSNSTEWPHDFRGRYIVRSMDTGRTWIRLELPMSAFDGSGIVNRQMLMDVRQHALWYTMVTDYLSGEINWYKTTDNGKTFEHWYGLSGALQVNGQAGSPYIEQAGVGYPGEIRIPWGPDPNIPRGVELWNADSENDHAILDWADSLEPGRPDTMSANNGNGFGIDYQFSQLNPDFLVLAIYQNFEIGGRAFDSVWWFFSSNGGRTFKNVITNSEVRALEDTGIFTSVFIDNRRPYTLWAVVNENGTTGTSSVYKLEIPHTTSTVVINTGLLTDGAWVRLYSSKMEIGNPSSGANHFNLYDILGRCLISGPLPLGNTEAIINLSNSLSEGAYFVSLVSKDGDVLKFVPVILR